MRPSKIVFLPLSLNHGILVVVAIVFFIASLRTVGMTVLELRRHVAKHMRDNQPIYGGLGDFELYGGCQAYFDSVGT